MKNKNIKLHSNITKIFKYLAFFIGFSFLFLLDKFVYIQAYVLYDKTESYTHTEMGPRGPVNKASTKVSTKVTISDNTYINGSNIYYKDEFTYSVSITISSGYLTKVNATFENKSVGDIKGTIKGSFTGSGKFELKSITFMLGLGPRGYLYSGTISNFFSYYVTKDTTLPTTSLNVDNNTIFANSHKITFSASDNQSGLKKKYYCYTR